MVSATSARPRGARFVVPAKMTSSILPPRRLFAPCSPMTQLRASTTLDLPEPFGPTTQVMPGSKRRVVGEAKDLKPFNVRLFRCIRGASVPARRQSAAAPRGLTRGKPVHRLAGGRQIGDDIVELPGRSAALQQ